MDELSIQMMYKLWLGRAVSMFDVQKLLLTCGLSHINSFLRKRIPRRINISITSLLVVIELTRYD